MLASHGMNATFYVNSSYINTGGGYLSWSELSALASAGNEIGGHTSHHVDLATLSDAEQQAEICNDMQAINGQLASPIHSFAYPFGSTGVNTQQILKDGCPGVGTYTSARSVGGLLSGTQCTACPTAESIPPANPYYISTPESINSGTTLDQMKTYVTQAEQNGGGWVPLLFHRVCDGCDPDSVTAANLEAFLTWLEARKTTNYTYVRTVNQVMTGDLPPPPPLPPLGPNQLINPSLEQASSNYPTCWQRTSWGTNSPSWTRTSDAHDGAYGEQIQVTAYTDGDIKTIQTQDSNQSIPGGCAPTVESGASYMLGAWYKSTTPVVVVVFYQDAGGLWQYWKDGPTLPAAANWTQMLYEPGTVPTGAQALSFGIAIQAVGTLITDDYSMQKILPSTTDTTPPVVSLTAPTAGSTVAGQVNVSADATDNVSVAGVQFKLDGVLLGAEDTLSPYTVSWNTLTASNGTHTLTAVARDAAGNVTTSAAVDVTVNNPVPDTTAPTVSITAPAAGTVSSTVTVTADATDDTGVVGVQFKLDGTNLGFEVTTAPYSIAWNTVNTADGTHTLTAVARDAAGHITTSSGVTVTVSNTTTTPTTPPTSGGGGGGGGSMGLIELALMMLITAFVAAARNGTVNARSDERES